jgi:hypothetical protein
MSRFVNRFGKTVRPAGSGKGWENNGGIGRGLETVVMACQRDVVRLEHLPACGARFMGGGKAQSLPICADFVGAFLGTGRGIFFDAKSCDNARAFPLGRSNYVKPHQREFLCRIGATGAAAGLVCEARALGGAVYWLDWTHLQDTAVTSVPWADPRLVLLGPVGMVIDFRKVPNLPSVPGV